ncbi:MAG: HAD family hydrolase [Verrucomicrobia bacterium]|nr:HAD family hydrolase [Verrucomicrobiota bacterium]
MAKERGWIFFDIDGTLLYARGSGREAFRQAFDEALGWEQSVEHINFYGATDLDVFRKICAERGEISTPAMEKAFFERLAPALDEQMTKNKVEVFPNIGKILPLLSNDWKATALHDSASHTSDPSAAKGWGNSRYPGSSGWKLGIVTGNIEATAKLKLKHAGLLKYFDERGFGCGCDHEDRVQIARHAWERAGRPRRAVLIGDTPNDIRAAKANRMVAIAVATGGFNFQALEKAGADFVFEDFTDTERLLSILNKL